MTETVPAKGRRTAREEIADLRRVGTNPEFWYPVVVSASVRKEKTLAARFAGPRIALYRGAAARSTRWRTSALTVRFEECTLQRAF